MSRLPVGHNMTSVPRSRGLSVSEAPTIRPAPSSGPSGSQNPSAVLPGPQDSPDLSHLTPAERRIIEEVLQRQKQEEQKDAQVLQKSSTTPVMPPRSAQTAPKPNQPLNGAAGAALTIGSTAPFGNAVASVVSGAINAVSGHSPHPGGILDAVCGICQKTKFADGLGHVCAQCGRKTCTRCGYQLNTNVDQVRWTCKPCAQRVDNSANNGGTHLTQRGSISAGGSSTGPKTTTTNVTPRSIDPKAAGRLVSGLFGMFGTGQPQQTTGTPGDPTRAGLETKRQLPQIGGGGGEIGSSRHPTWTETPYTGSSRALPKPNTLSRSTSLDPERESGMNPSEARYQRGYLSRQYTDSGQIDDRELLAGRAYRRVHGWDNEMHGSYQSNPSFDPYQPSMLASHRIRGRDARYPPSLTPSRLDLPAYGTDSMTSDHSESPGRSGSVSGWSATAGPSRKSPMAMRYPVQSESDFPNKNSPSSYMTPTGARFSTRARGGGNQMDRIHAPYHFSAVPPDGTEPPSAVPYRSFSSSEGEEFNMLREDPFLYPTGSDFRSVSIGGKPRRALPSDVLDPRGPSLLPDEPDEIQRLSYAGSRSPATYSSSDIVYGSRQAHLSSSMDMTVSPRSGRLAVDYQSAGSQRADPFYPAGTNSLLSIPTQPPLTHPVTWNPSRDGKRLIGHMILRRQSDRGSGDVGSLLGLKISGGKPNHAGRLCAYITRVKPGSPADVVGQLRPGDEVLEWNGQSVRDCTADEVSDIVHQSKMDAQVELIVQRDLDSSNEYFPDEYRSQSSSPSEGFNLPVPLSSTQSLPDKWDHQASLHRPSVQLSLWFDHEKAQLVVHLLCARDLTPTYQATSSSVCNSYCRIRLLPGRDDSTLKYSKLVARTNHPRWNQQFLFTNYTENEVAQHDLELTVWNCALNSNEQTLMGEIIVDLSVADLSGATYWYPLQMAHIGDYSSGAPTPVVGSMTGYESQLRRDHSRTLLTSSNEAATLTSRSPDSRGQSDYTAPGIPRSGDYSDIDEKTYAPSGQYGALRVHSGTTAHHRTRGHREHRRSRQYEYGPEEVIAHSDISEMSDVSELSRMSLHAYQPEKERFTGISPSRASFSTGRRYSTTQPYQTTQGIGAELQKQQISPESSSRSDRPPEPDDTSDEFSMRQQRRLAASQRDELRLAKESSSSECGSGMVSSSTGGGGGGYGKLSTTSLPKDGQSASQRTTSAREDGRKPRPSIGHKFSTVLGRSHKSSSTSNLDKKTRSSFQRSEEVLPHSEAQYDDVNTTSSARHGRIQTQLSFGSGKMDMSQPNEGADYDSPILTRNESHVGEFVEGLGPGQLVGRQVLGMPCLGEIQLSFYDRKGHLEVEVIRARGLQHKNTAKPLPAPYVKLHLLEGKQSVEKLRTTTPPRRTLDPLYQQQLTFSVPYHGKIIQISIWGEHGRMDKKVFLGMCEVVLDDLDLRSVVFGWYKLFGMIASNAHHHHHHNRPTSTGTTASTGAQSELDGKCSADEGVSLSSSKGRDDKTSPRGVSSGGGAAAGGGGSKSHGRGSMNTERARTKSVSEKMTGARKSTSREPHKQQQQPQQKTNDPRAKGTHKQHS